MSDCTTCQHCNYPTLCPALREAFMAALKRRPDADDFTYLVNEAEIVELQNDRALEEEFTHMAAFILFEERIRDRVLYEMDACNAWPISGKHLAELVCIYAAALSLNDMAQQADDEAA